MNKASSPNGKIDLVDRILKGNGHKRREKTSEMKFSKPMVIISTPLSNVKNYAKLRKKGD